MTNAFHTLAVDGRNADLSLRVQLMVTFENKGYTDKEFTAAVRKTRELADIVQTEMQLFFDGLTKPKRMPKKKEG